MHRGDARVAIWDVFHNAPRGREVEGEEERGEGEGGRRTMLEDGEKEEGRRREEE